MSRSQQRKQIFAYVIKKAIKTHLIQYLLMEQKKKIGASVGYGKSAELSRYKALAQKLAQNIEKLSQDPSFKKRWVWQLIQNAKDAPNEFNKVNMRIQIYDSQLKFMHNGDPFRSCDLESIVNQYSTKKQKNQQGTETTGKYGTGFITTYILSRNIQIQGIIKPTPESDQQDELQQEKIKGRKMIKVNQKPVKKQVPEQENFYQRFKVLLKREYSSRDKDFPKSLMINDEEIRNSLNELEYLKPWKRKEKDLDTEFCYKKMDSSSNQIIQKGIKSLRDLFPYALLFNPRLNQIVVEDYRNQHKIQGFTIKRSFPPQKNIVNIFTCTIINSNNIKQIKLAFHQDKASASIIAVPIEIRGQQKHLCSIPQDTPKMFKQFPLIGTENIGYNYIFTSKKLYPNQQRSSLLLGIQGQKQKQNTQKVKQNWRVLKIVFQRARNMYTCLKVFINASKQNFLQLSTKQYLARTQEDVSSEYKNFMQQVSKYQIFQCLNGEHHCLDQITFICFGYPLVLKQQQKSKQMIDVFAFLFPKQHILKQEVYQIIYKKLYEFKQTKWPVKYLTLYDCIAEIQKRSFDQLCNLSGSQQKFKANLHKVYKYLIAYKPFFLGAKSQAKIFLTENMQLEFGNQLYLRGSLDEKYVKILDDLELKLMLNTILVNSQMQNYFNSTKINAIYRIKPIELQLIRKQIIDAKFESPEINSNLQLFQNYLRYLQTIQIGKNIIQIIKVCKKFKNLNYLGDGIVNFPNISKFQAKQYQTYLVVAFLNYLQNSITSERNLSVKSFSSFLNLPQKSQAAKLIATIQWFDSVLWLQSTYLEKASSILTWSICKNSIFVKSESLMYMQTELDDQDIKFFNLYKINKQVKKEGSGKQQKQQNSSQIKCQILNKLVHSKVTYVANLNKAQYSYQFRQAISSFSLLNDQKKKQFLNYVEHLMKCHRNNKADANQKIKQFKNFLSIRHIQLLRISNFSEKDISIIYDLIKNKDQLPIIEKLKEKNDLKNVLTIMNNIK